MTSQSVLEILIQAVDESTAALEGAQNNLKQVGQEALSAGTQLTLMGAAITGAYVGVVSSAASVQESQDNLKQAVTDAMVSASTSTGSYATQVKFLQDKIDSYNASIAEATATLDTHTGSTEKSTAAHEKASATIATAQANIAKYQAQLDLLTNAQDLNGQSSDSIVSKLEDQADANVALGFSVADSTQSLSQAFTATKSVSDALAVNEAAMDLARAKNIDLATATNQVILAMNGQGRALATYGIQIKDGLSGMDALQAVQSAVNGQAQAYAQTLSGQLAVAMQSFNKLLSDMGNTQLPVLTELLQLLVKIIDAIDDFTQKHQKLTETILLSIGILGTLITVLGTLLIVFGTVAIAVALLGGPFTLLIGLVAVLAATIIANWQNLKDDITAIWQAIWQTIQNIWQNFWNIVAAIGNYEFGWILNLFHTNLGDIQTTWNTVWTAIGNFFSSIWTGIENAVTNSINFVRSAINSFVSWVQGILGPILGPINAVGSAASSFLKGVVSYSTGGLINVHDAIITPSGQVIQSDPNDYLIATKTPGSLGAGTGNGGITVNINGGMYLDQGGAKAIGDEITKQIVRQLKVRNYAT